MTQTTTSTEPRPADLLLHLIVALLTPMFLGIAGGNIDMARIAAIQTLNDYRARNRADLLAVAQIIAFGIAALGSLSLSMADDISTAMAMRLRSNANACHRSAEQNRRALTQHRDANTPAPLPDLASPPIEDEPIRDEPGPVPAATAHITAAEAEHHRQQPEQPGPSGDQRSQQRRNQEMWAIVYTKEAGEIEASLPNLPPSEREQALMRSGTLRSAANHLLTGISPAVSLAASPTAPPPTASEPPS